MSDKTEEATPRRLRKAIEDGDSGASGALVQSLSFIAALALASAAVSALAIAATTSLRVAIRSAAERSPTIDLDWAAFGASVLMLAAPILFGVGAVAIAVGLVQSGGVIASKKLVPTLSRLNLASGFANLVTGARIFSVVRAYAVGILTAAVAATTLISHARDIAALVDAPRSALPLAGELALMIAWRSAALGVAFGILDRLVVHGAWRARLRMSKAELKREHRENDGDPELKAARERAHQEALRGSELANVRQASVVIVNPTHRAIALRYAPDDGDDAPIVMARGHGDFAKQIVRAARDYNVPVVRDVPLARALSELESGDAIPEDLYEAVAAILRTIVEEEEPVA